jgi:Rha family phage regulatory protein
MSQLELINYNGKFVADSRSVAEMIERNHADLLRDIRKYMEFLSKSNFALAEFFIESFYIDAQRKTRPHYFLTKKGCDMVANKMTGEKGILFTAAYVTKFEEMEKQTETSQLSPQLQFMIQMEQRQNNLESTVNQLSENLTSVPDTAKVVSTVNEYARFTRLSHNQVYNKVYEVLKYQHGIDVRQRVSNERERIQLNYHESTGKWYAESTLKQRVNGIDVMVRLGCLDKFQLILSGMLAKEKTRNILSLSR